MLPSGFLPCGNLLVKAQAAQTLFWFHWTACGESGPLPQVVLFDRSVWSDRNLLFHVKKFSFPFLLCQAVIKLSVKTESTTSICLVTLGAFHSTKMSGLHFWQLPVENGIAFSKICKKRTTLRGITRFSETFSWKFSVHSTLLSEFLEFLVERFTFRIFNSLWNFWKRFWEISVQFAFVSKFSKVLVEWKVPFQSMSFHFLLIILLVWLPVWFGFVWFHIKHSHTHSSSSFRRGCKAVVKFRHSTLSWESLKTVFS